MSDTASQNRELAEKLWHCLTSKDYEVLRSLFTEDAAYTDVATPEDDVARGGQEVVMRLRLAFDGVDITNSSRNVVAGDEAVMVERVETWHWRTGERLDLPIASVVEVSGDKISRWVDYWDMQTFLNSAPAWWLEQVMQGWR